MTPAFDGLVAVAGSGLVMASGVMFALFVGQILFLDEPHQTATPPAQSPEERPAVAADTADEHAA